MSFSHCYSRNFSILSWLFVGTSPIIRIVLLSLSFTYFYLRSQSHNLLNCLLTKQISFIYFFNSLFILFELFLINTSNTSILSFLSNGRYKAHIANYTQIPQSILNQSQAASQLLVIFLVWIFSAWLDRVNLIKHKVFIAAYILLLIYVSNLHQNTTSLALLLLGLCLTCFTLPNSRTAIFNFSLRLIPLSLLPYAFQTLTFKINLIDGHKHALGYIFAFTHPLQIFSSSSLHQKLFGYGSMERLVSIANLQSADFGLAVFLLQSGVLITVLFSLFVFLPVLYLYNLVFITSRSRTSMLISNPWVWLGLVNSSISLMYFASLVHYTVAFQTGGAHLFSYHLSIVLLSIYKIKRINLVDSSNIYASSI